ncbi:hypothetical protein [Mycoplasma sp. Mirounga ES2805-ORL]|uniref:hypothetical protein n=1 Tax=Mycoplasma sp. Mirounga ES2805-ORL TaxID=754514 RepID=UPI00197C186D|nr:hypothetical protein [Mycoplasma sp. Mirounga ES2805-ORL]QSF13929.1 hypothetical protein JXZ90_01365 [Mycoplasma sp. Mirounga ES2805-ORL]
MNKKRLILSRHGLRYTFFDRAKSLKIFNKDIVNWEDDKLGNGFLTQKGIKIEEQFGKFLKEFLKIDSQTKIKTIANSIDRTYKTAQTLLQNMQPEKDNDIFVTDPNLNTHENRFDIKLSDITNIDFNLLNVLDKESKSAYQKIIDLFNIENSNYLNIKNNVSHNEKNDWLNTEGPLFWTSSFSDLLQSKYYDGVDQNKIFQSNNFIEDLKLISKTKDRVIDLLWTNKDVLVNSEENIYHFLKDELTKVEDLTLLVGHDVSIAPILKMLDVKMPEHNQLEKYPIGSKLLFEINGDGTFDLSYMFYDYNEIRSFKLTKPIVLKLGYNLHFK